MAASTDGFELAEKDLEIRGAGEVFGERQSGISDLKLGRIPRDEPVVIEARRVAEQILDDDPDLAAHAQLARRGRGPPRRRRRVPLQVVSTAPRTAGDRGHASRGRRLVAPEGDQVRPTKDIVREAMFSALDARGALVDATVLDLYAGTGALAIEALSRGASAAVLVERDRGRAGGDPRQPRGPR